jgi:hypothetical protein
MSASSPRGFGRLGGLTGWENYRPLARAALYAQGIDNLLAPTWDSSDVGDILRLVVDATTHEPVTFNRPDPSGAAVPEP